LVRVNGKGFVSLKSGTHVTVPSVMTLVFVFYIGGHVGCYVDGLSRITNV